jgi:TonB family protein
MILAWMVYCLVISLLIGCSARVLEYGLNLYGRPIRWVWAGAILGALALPVVTYLVPGDGPLAPALLAPFATVSVMDLLTMEPVSHQLSSLSLNLDRLVLGLWLVGSALLLAFYVRAYLRLREERKEWPGGRVCGRDVSLSRAIGPAVGGFFRSFIVVPTWVLDLNDEQQLMIVLHEEEHLRAWDHRLLVAASLLLFLVPWNLPLWFHFRRLHLAVELDCDRRVLEGHADRRTYGEVLLEVGRRTSGLIVLPAALSERRHQLERRVRNMSRKVAKHRGKKLTVAAIAAGALIALACETPTPQGEDSPVVPTEVTPSLDEGPVFTPMTEMPSLTNRSEALQAVERNYPKLLRDAGIGGKVNVWILIGADGTIEKAQVQMSSGHAALDEAAVRAARVFQFSPARNQGKPVPVWISVPITFTVQK